MSDNLDDHPDLAHLDQALDFVATRGELTYVIPWVITGSEMMDFLDAIAQAKAGREDAAAKLWSFIGMLGVAITQVLAKDPSTIADEEE